MHQLYRSQAKAAFHFIDQVVHEPSRRYAIDDIMIDQHGQMKDLPFLNFTLIDSRLHVQGTKRQA
jgi:hypothetical protein